MLVSVLLVGCGTNNNDGTTDSCGVDELIGKNLSEESDMTMELVASEKNLPSNFEGMVFERKEAPYFQYLVIRAENQSEYKRHGTYLNGRSKHRV